MELLDQLSSLELVIGLVEEAEAHKMSLLEYGREVHQQWKSVIECAVGRKLKPVSFLENLTN